MAAGTTGSRGRSGNSAARGVRAGISDWGLGISSGGSDKYARRSEICVAAVEKVTGVCGDRGVDAGDWDRRECRRVQPDGCAGAAPARGSGDEPRGDGCRGTDTRRLQAGRAGELHGLGAAEPLVRRSGGAHFRRYESDRRGRCYPCGVSVFVSQLFLGSTGKAPVGPRLQER